MAPPNLSPSAGVNPPVATSLAYSDRGWRAASAAGPADARCERTRQMPDMHRPSLSRSSPIGSDAAVLAEITDVVRQVLEDRTIELAPDTAVSDMADWDSLNHIAILVEAECRFD